MNTLEVIDGRAERMKRHYPRELYRLAQRAIQGDMDADLQLMRAVAKPSKSWWRRVVGMLTQ